MTSNTPTTTDQVPALKKLRDAFNFEAKSTPHPCQLLWCTRCGGYTRTNNRTSQCCQHPNEPLEYFIALGDGDADAKQFRTPEQDEIDELRKRLTEANERADLQTALAETLKADLARLRDQACAADDELAKETDEHFLLLNAKNVDMGNLSEDRDFLRKLCLAMAGGTA
jgi:hypothetical protein